MDIFHHFLFEGFPYVYTCMYVTISLCVCPSVLHVSDSSGYVHSFFRSSHFRPIRQCACVRPFVTFPTHQTMCMHTCALKLLLEISILKFSKDIHQKVEGKQGQRKMISEIVFDCHCIVQGESSSTFWVMFIKIPKLLSRVATLVRKYTFVHLSHFRPTRLCMFVRLSRFQPSQKKACVGC